MGGEPFNVPGTMANPKLAVYRKETDGTDTLLLTQDNWGDPATSDNAAYTAQIAQQVFAFASTPGSADAAFVVTLPPGAYTVIGSSADGTSTGVCSSRYTWRSNRAAWV